MRFTSARLRTANGDGIGDLPGILSKLDYLNWLGVDCLWLTPFYPSPMADYGYDVSDYIDVDAEYGTLADFDNLLAAVHRMDMRLIIDFVPNHTTIEHEWLVISRITFGTPQLVSLAQTRGKMEGHRTTGSAALAQAPGNSTRRRHSITCTRISSSRPI